MEKITVMILFCIAAGFILSCPVTWLSSRLSEKNGNFSLRGHCGNCLKSLYFFEIIPIFSYIIFKGKCRGCKEKIDPLFFIQEILNTLLYGLIAYKFGITPKSVIYCLMISCLLVYCYIDIRKNENSKTMITILFILGIISMFSSKYPFYEHLIGFAAGFLILLALSVFSKGSFKGSRYIGAFSACGLIMGYKSILIMIVFCFIFLLIWIFIIAILKRKENFIKINFSPFLFAGTVFSVFASETIISSIMKFIA